jgi:RNA recognition motif-containing protein
MSHGRPRAAGPPPPGRAAMEKPNRTLFVRNISYGTTEDSVRRVFEQYGTLSSVFSRIDQRGMIFLTFVSCSVLLPRSSFLVSCPQPSPSFSVEFASGLVSDGILA